MLTFPDFLGDTSDTYISYIVIIMIILFESGNMHKLTIRPGLAGTVPVWKCMSRNPERCLRDAKMSRFWPFWDKFGCNHVMSLCIAKN